MYLNMVIEIIYFRVIVIGFSRCNMGFISKPKDKSGITDKGCEPSRVVGESVDHIVLVCGGDFNSCIFPNTHIDK